MGRGRPVVLVNKMIADYQLITMNSQSKPFEISHLENSSVNDITWLQNRNQKTLCYPSSWSERDHNHNLEEPLQDSVHILWK